MWRILEWTDYVYVDRRKYVTFAVLVVVSGSPMVPDRTQDTYVGIKKKNIYCHFWDYPSQLTVQTERRVKYTIMALWSTEYTLCTRILFFQTFFSFSLSQPGPPPTNWASFSATNRDLQLKISLNKSPFGYFFRLNN